MNISNIASPGDTIQFNLFWLLKNDPKKKGYGKVVLLEVFGENLIDYIVNDGKTIINVPKGCIVRVWPKKRKSND